VAEAAVAGSGRRANGSREQACHGIFTHSQVSRGDKAEGLRRTTLPNGLTVLSEFMPGVRSVAFGAWVRAASLHEPRERMGVSHLLEHMVFKGTHRRTAKDIALSLEQLGGSLDAYTSREHTVYQARVLDEHLEIAVDVIGDLVFEPVLRSTDLTLERNVVIEEIGMVEDTPDDLVFELHNAALWGDHPLGYSILGTRESVASLDVKDLKQLHRRAYRPSQRVVAAAGNVDHDALIDILTKTGWTDRSAEQAKAVVVPAPKAATPSRQHVERAGSQTHIVLGSPTLGHDDKRRHALVLLSVVLGSGMSSRLFQRVREELGLAYSVYTFQTFYATSGVQGVYVGTAPKTAAAALDAIERELATVVANGLLEEEIAQGKGQLKGQITLSLESPTARMYRAASVDLYGEPYRTLDEMLALVEAIDPVTVHDLAREYLTPDRQTVVTLGPGAVRKPVRSKPAKRRSRERG
jgi:predicted Zn-dependent peptidase